LHFELRSCFAVDGFGHLAPPGQTHSTRLTCFERGARRPLRPERGRRHDSNDRHGSDDDRHDCGGADPPREQHRDPGGNDLHPRRGPDHHHDDDEHDDDDVHDDDAPSDNHDDDTARLADDDDRAAQLDDLHAAGDDYRPGSDDNDDDPGERAAGAPRVLPPHLVGRARRLRRRGALRLQGGREDDR
jgi:hypothetical protein